MTKGMAKQKSQSGCKLSGFLTVDNLLRQTLEAIRFRLAHSPWRGALTTTTISCKERKLI